MTRLLVSVAFVAISTAALAQGAGPTRTASKCFVPTDARGFGYWTKCPLYTEEQARRGFYQTFIRAEGGGGADGGGGGGGGGNR